jgi:hypothetical protein
MIAVIDAPSRYFVEGICENINGNEKKNITVIRVRILFITFLISVQSN